MSHFRNSVPPPPTVQAPILVYLFIGVMLFIIYKLASWAVMEMLEKYVSTRTKTKSKKKKKKHDDDSE